MRTIEPEIRLSVCLWSLLAEVTCPVEIESDTTRFCRQLAISIGIW